MVKLLIVDDEWTIREGLAKTVPWSEWGIEVSGTASNGKEALQGLKNNSVDILLTDIRMPGLSGLELIELCTTEHPHLKIVILTGHDEFEYAQKAVKLGADDFLLKPTNLVELEKTMRNIVEQIKTNTMENDAMLAMLIKELVVHHTLENISKIEAYKNINQNFGMVIAISAAIEKRHVNLKNVISIDHSDNKTIYFCHDINNEEHWIETINSIKQAISSGSSHTNIYASLLANKPEQIINSYKQASIASTIYYRNNNTTIYKYHDEKYSMDFEDIIRFINQNYSEPISLADLANQLNMSNSYFSKLFKQHTGMNFVDYLTTKRIKAAKELLTSTTLKTYEIANTVGYVESRYFSQLFKKIVGCTPLEFRKHGSGLKNLH
ncbi:response regulator [Virgibacillus halodenitrificans]|uniref:response regulator transcription factor n=1 Tax=Virgibacillus halodenitrificans TaxID=1482 RepID=UPI00136FCBBB|nr:response regulator [Virgibacillus halodenitrificans]MYL45162.1 response regulator [Virgibacillus halodenitrificans]WHX26361.1 response regulator [Virgibacillus halodenitrificans]